MELIKGENISIGINGKVLSCWRSSTLQITADAIGKSTKGSGNFKEFEGSALSWQVSGEGLLYQDADFDIHDAYDLMKTLANVFVVFTVTAYDDAGVFASVVYYYGAAIITGITETGNVNDNASFNVSLQGTGELYRDDEILYGIAPYNLQVTHVSVDDPTAGQSTLTLIWFQGDPIPTSYTLKVVDNTTVTTTEITGITDFDGYLFVIDSTHNYTFSVKSIYYGIGESNYSSSINYP